MTTAVASHSIYVGCHHVLPSRLRVDGRQSHVSVLDLGLLAGPDTPTKQSVRDELLAWQKQLGKSFSTVSFRLPNDVSLRELKVAQLVFE